LGSAHIKAAHKMLAKLTPGFDFINYLCAALTKADPKIAKRQSGPQCLLGSTHTKAAHEMLVKSTHGLTGVLCFEIRSLSKKSYKKRKLFFIFRYRCSL